MPVDLYLLKIKGNGTGINIKGKFPSRMFLDFTVIIIMTGSMTIQHIFLPKP